MNGRTVTFSIHGIPYTLCFTLSAAEKVFDRYGDMDGWLKAVQELQEQGGTMRVFAEYLWLLSVLLDAGYEFASYDSGEAEPPPGLEELKQLLCVGDMHLVQDGVIRAITLGNRREVGVAAPPNGEGAESEGQAPTG